MPLSLLTPITFFSLLGAVLGVIAVADLIPGLHKRSQPGATTQQAVLLAFGSGEVDLAHSTLHARAEKGFRYEVELLNISNPPRASGERVGRRPYPV